MRQEPLKEPSAHVHQPLVVEDAEAPGVSAEVQDLVADVTYEPEPSGYELASRPEGLLEKRPTPFARDQSAAVLHCQLVEARRQGAFPGLIAGS